MDTSRLTCSWALMTILVLLTRSTVFMMLLIVSHSGTRQPILILEELSRLANQPPEVADLTSEIRQKYRHWLLHFPAQCVVIAECILWERSMARILEKTDPEELRALR